MEDKSVLYIVATPIGNLDDITHRAVETLRSVDVIACEDTRHSRILLDRFSIKAELVSCHEHNETQAARKIISLIENESRSVALISDAGTPAVSDPGFRVVEMAVAHGIKVVPIPGVSAAITALCAGGLPTDSFYFAGFLPAREGAMIQKMESCSRLEATLIFYVSPHKIVRTLQTAEQVFGGNRRAVVARELTKLYETFNRSTLRELAMSAAEDEMETRGEIVLLVEGYRKAAHEISPEDIGRAVAEYLANTPGIEKLGARKMTMAAAKELNLPRNKVYPHVCEFLNNL